MILPVPDPFVLFVFHTDRQELPLLDQHRQWDQEHELYYASGPDETCFEHDLLDPPQRHWQVRLSRSLLSSCPWQCQDRRSDYQDFEIVSDHECYCWSG